ncbi:MAG: hypothetical protein M0Z56_05025 [Desulfobacteraceae bacterium]|nr:hypothetical protein [Desulfobacteraceae bacterium]
MSDSRIDNLERHCPRLGGEISFRYCAMSGEDDGFCWKILDCWWEAFDVENYLKANMPEAAFQALMATADKPKNKIASILQVVEQAKKKKGEKSP